MIIIAVYVDDLIEAGKSLTRVNQIKSSISKRYSVKGLGELDYFLGVEIKQDHINNKIWLGQSVYCENVKEKFSMSNCKSIETPAASCTKLASASDDNELVDKKLYRLAVGSLLYLSTRTRPA